MIQMKPLIGFVVGLVVALLVVVPLIHFLEIKTNGAALFFGIVVGGFLAAIGQCIGELLDK